MMELNIMNQVPSPFSSGYKSKQTFHFQDGQLITGKILRFLPEGNALLQIGQSTLTARLEANVNALDQYWFQVMMTNNRLTLKVLDNQNQKNKPLAEQVLLHHRLLPSKEAIDLVKKLMKDDIPFTKTQLIDAVKWLQESKRSKSPFPIEMRIESLAFAIKRNWPISNEMIHSILTFHRKEGLAEDLTLLLRWLQTEQKLTPTLTQLKNVLSQLLITSMLEDNGGTVGKEESLKGTFNLKQDEVGHKFGLTNHNQNQNVVILSEHIKTMLKQISSLLGLQYERMLKQGEKAEIDQFVQQSLKPLLISGLDEVKDSNIRELIQKIIHRLNGHALLSTQEGPVEHLFYQWPLQVHQLLTDFSLSLYGKKKQDGKIDPHHCRIVFDLKLPNVQDIIVDIFIQNKIIKVTILNDVVTNDDVNRYLDYLRERLNHFDYYLSSITVKSMNREIHEKKMKEMLDNTSYQKVDIKI